jgi:hypothetical protein
LATIAASGWLTSCAIDALISPSVATRLAWASAVCAASSAACDVEAKAPAEADHIVGDLLRRRRVVAPSRGQLSLLATAFAHLKAYETRRERTIASSRPATQ